MKNINFLKENLIAHRGYHDESLKIPENSMPAFKRAIENNYIIELDVHLLKDGNIVVFHDDDLKRMTNLEKNLKDTTYEEIQNLKLNNTENKIPLLSEVLDLVKDRVPIIIELKTDLKTGKLETKLMEILKRYKGRFAVKSFNPLSVYWFKKNYPDIVRGQLAEDFKNNNMCFIKKKILSNMWFNIISKPDFISYNIESMPNNLVEKYRKKHIVLGWTVRNKVQYEKGKKYCDNLICENFEQYIKHDDKVNDIIKT